jgi:signal transduction histidine kinase
MASSGSGLGLAIAQWVACSHGGIIKVYSESGFGATFEVRLPLAPQATR